MDIEEYGTQVIANFYGKMIDKRGDVMRLSSINEVDVNKAINRVSPLLDVMPKHKRNHSKRVAKTLRKAGVGKIGIYSGLLHDYLERGGNLFELTQHIDELGLPQQIVNVVLNLSDDEDNAETSPNQPLAHLQQVLNKTTNQDIKNIIILAKLSDRLDNLRKRARKGKIGKNYLSKSSDLIQWLSDQYTGKNKPFKKLVHMFQKLGLTR